MNKRLEKRHKRQVARAKDRVKVSEPDVRTPEEVRAARQASRPAAGWRNAAQSQYSTPSLPDHKVSTGSKSKADG